LEIINKVNEEKRKEKERKGKEKGKRKKKVFTASGRKGCRKEHNSCTRRHSAS
jgi:hypothetical protein